jgi:apolipoprotein N-acyltransferase
VAALVVAPWHWLYWVVLVPWLLALDRTASWRGALGSGVSMAVAFTVAVFSWFPFAIADYASVPVWITATLSLVAAPIFQPQFIVFALVRHGARRRGLGVAATAVAGAFAYVAAEWALPKLFGDTLGFGLHPSRWMRQAADVAGATGLTLAIVAGNECVRASIAALRARAAVRRVLGPVAALAAMLTALAGYGRMRVAELDGAPAGTPVVFGIVQANVAHYDRLAAEVGTYEAVRRILDAHLAVTSEVLARGPIDVLVWPETVYPTTFGTPKSEDGATFDRLIAGFVAKTGRPLVFGAYDAEEGREYNAAVFLEPDGRGGVTFDVYRKATLFPLTERVPAWLDGAWLRAWLPWLGSWHAGTGPSVMALQLPSGPLRVAPLICYDAVDARVAARAVRDGAEVIVTLSNDSWLDDGAGARLHFIVSVFRSIETRRGQVRATTTGISAVVSPAGDVVESAGIAERAGLVGTLTPVRGTPPLAVRWGDWLGPVGLVAAAALLARRGRRA